MRKLVSAAGLALLLPFALMAQETPQAELFTGFSYLRLEKTNQVGWNVSLDGNINKNLGIVADASGYYNSQTETINGITGKTSGSIHSILVGPRVSDPRGRFNPFAQALFGWSRLHLDAATLSTSQGPVLTLPSDSTNGFAVALGGGIDYKLTDRLALRMIQIEYFMVRPHSGKEQGARVGGGLVFRLGQKKQ